MKNPLSAYKGLNRSIYLMALVTFINCLAEFIGPFFSLYLTVRLGYDMKTAGLMVSLLIVCHIPGALLGGKLCDKIGRKTIIVCSQTLMGVSFILCGFFLDAPYAPLFVFLGSFFDGITDPARRALEVDVTKPEQRQAAFSLIYQALNMGFAIGPMLAGFLFYKYPAWLFFGNGIVEVLSVLLIVFFVPESKPSEKELQDSQWEKTAEKAVEGNIFTALKQRPQLLWLALIAFFVSFAYKQITFTLPLQTTTLFGESGSAFYGTILSVNALIVIFLNPIVLSFSQHIDARRNILIGCLLYAVAFLLFGFSKLPWQFFVLTAVYTIGEILFSNNFKTYQNNNTPINFRGRFNTVLPISKTIGATLAPLMGGVILSVFPFSALWTISSLSVLMGIGILVCKVSDKPY
ncbi:MFS transporter [uncultured Sphaerochaeta sp.]|uniref:MDR family MFS transporter n=1 Tax=uncultured Sphaerochaeta sp. TaxID=886478 RepID=UPI002A0A97D2|nr:MFS transporter [uncultured Sphaerochaeta sp.]